MSIRMWLGGLVVGAIAAAGLPRAAQADEPGVWQKHEYSFQFMGFTTTYSCDGLASKLKVLLLAAGARPDVKSRAGACATGFGRPDKFSRADLTFYSLAPAKAASGSAPASGSAAAPANAATPDAGTPVGGVWQAVTFSDRQPRELARGDCELVEQFRTSVLPMFSVRNIDNRTTCIPHQESGSIVDLKFETFRALPKPPPAKG